MPEPAYVAYEPVVLLAGGRYVPVPTAPDSQFMVTVGALEERLTPATKAILLGYPSNPTGAVLERPAMEAIARFAEANDLFVVADELYDRSSTASSTPASPRWRGCGSARSCSAASPRPTR